jgi:hypothetical protein
MWTPKQLLYPNVVQTLRESGKFPEPLIEFLGWSQGRANILNRNPNPVKCALTMLRDDPDNAKTHEWLQKFYKRKQDSIRPVVETTMDNALRISKKIEKLAEPEEAWLLDENSPAQVALDNE